MRARIPLTRFKKYNNTRKNIKKLKKITITPPFPISEFRIQHPSKRFYNQLFATAEVKMGCPAHTGFIPKVPPQPPKLTGQPDLTGNRLFRVWREAIRSPVGVRTRDLRVQSRHRKPLDQSPLAARY